MYLSDYRIIYTLLENKLIHIKLNFTYEGVKKSHAYTLILEPTGVNSVVFSPLANYTVRTMAVDQRS
jgi:hypothetical protein